MSLAIVIPYYRFRFFGQTLHSLATQTDKRFTVYIGDDASPENPQGLLDAFTGKFDFAYHRFDENLGGKSLVRQWHRCIGKIAGEQWLMILGDDDVLGPECVAEFYKQLPEVAEAAVVRYATVKIDGAGNETSEIYTHPKREKAADFLFNKRRSSLSEYLFRADTVRTIGFRDFPLAWFSDILGVLEFSGFGTIYSINEALVFVRISDYNISGRNDNLKAKADAVFLFHHYLLSQKPQHFTHEQRLALLQQLAKSYLFNKKHPDRFFKVSAMYLKMGQVNGYLSFIKSFFAKALQP
jgi:glycosyltransferase involved in cell wall biosynthesis